MENQTTPEAAVPAAAGILKNRKVIFISLGIAAFLIVGALLVAQGYVIAATVNGKPISRLSVIKELEAQSGKKALESRVQKMLLASELAKAGVSVSKEEVDAEIQKIEAQVSGQGGTLKDALAAQGMTEEQLRGQIEEQKQIEKMFADKVQVTDEEVDAYIKEQKLVASQGETADAHKAEVKEQLRRQKLQTEAQTWISGLAAGATIKYYVNY